MLVAFSIKLDRIDESLLFVAQDGSYWLSGVCTFEEDQKGRTIVAQSIPRERFATGERGPAIGTWREIGGQPKPPVREGKGFELAKFKTAATQRKPTGAGKYPPGE